jgi:hypothetical protein
VVSIMHGMPTIVTEILKEANQPMTIKELAATIDGLGRVHKQESTYDAVTKAIGVRMKKHGDIERVGRGVYKYRSTDAAMR